QTVGIDIALLDSHMPIMSGREMYDLMNKDSQLSKIPVIFITSEGSSESIKMLFKSGVRYIHKPFTPELLHETVVAVLEEKYESSV
ncbi:response regulator, partial [Candidatus Poribacteria bacterium]|nr:response regulator [Candidatus Poribacteria bacterium]